MSEKKEKQADSKQNEAVGSYAVIETGGKQYKVSVGDTVLIDKIDAEKGSEVVFDRVLAIKKDESLTLGAPLVDGSKVTATALKFQKDKKIDVFKKIRRKGFTKKIGHRQDRLVVQVTAIQ